MKKLIFALFAVVAIAFLSPMSQAAIVISVEVDPPVDAGDTAQVGVFATSADGDNLTGFALPIEIGGDGFIGLNTNVNPNPNPLPFPLSFNASPIANPIAAGVTPNFAGFQNGFEPSISGNPSTDVIVNLGGAAPVVLSATPTKLFDIVLDVDPDAPAGSFPVTVIENSTFFQVTSTGGVAVASAPASGAGSVNITAVPEPGSMLALGSMAVGGMIYRRRKSAKKS